jgi:hypothetical protein
MAKDPVRITQYQPGQGLAEGLKESAQRFSTGLDSLLRGYIGYQGLQLDKEQVDNALTVGMANAQNAAERNRILDDQGRKQNILAMAELEQKAINDSARIILERRSMNQKARSDFQANELAEETLYAEKEQNKKLNKRAEIKDRYDLIKAATDEGEYEVAYNLARSGSSKDPSLLPNARVFGGYVQDIKKFNDAWSDYQDNPTATLEEKSSLLDTAGSIYRRLPFKFKDQNPAFFEARKEVTAALNTKNALVRMFDTKGTPLDILSRYYDDDDMVNFLAQIKGAQSLPELEMVVNKIGSDISFSQENMKEKSKSLDALFKGIVVEAQKEGDVTAVSGILQNIRSQQQGLGSIVGFGQKEDPISPINITEEQLKEREVPQKGTIAAGAGNKTYFQTAGTNEVVIKDHDEAVALENKGSGRIVGSYGSSVENIEPNMEIYDDKGNTYKVATISRSSPGAKMSPAGIPIVASTEERIRLTKIDPSGKISYDDKSYTPQEIKKNFSSTPINKPSPKKTLMKEAEIPLDEFVPRGYSVSEAQNILIKRFEKQLGKKFADFTDDERENVRSEVHNLLMQGGYGKEVGQP